MIIDVRCCCNPDKVLGYVKLDKEPRHGSLVVFALLSPRAGELNPEPRRPNEMGKSRMCAGCTFVDDHARNCSYRIDWGKEFLVDKALTEVSLSYRSPEQKLEDARYGEPECHCLGCQERRGELEAKSKK